MQKFNSKNSIRLSFLPFIFDILELLKNQNEYSVQTLKVELEKLSKIASENTSEIDKKHLSQALNEQISEVLEYAKNVEGVAFAVNSERTKFTKYPTKPLTEKEFEDLNYHEIKDLYIPYNKYWDHTQKEGASSLNLKKEGDAHADMVDTQKFFVETIRMYTSSHCPWKCGFCNSHSFLRVSNATMEDEEKIPKKPQYIKTIRGKGYMLICKEI